MSGTYSRHASTYKPITRQPLPAVRVTRTQSRDAEVTMTDTSIPGRLALLIGGGPAPGINGVISAVTIEAIEQGIEVIGFRDGFKWLVKGEDRHVNLSIGDVKGIHLRGGSFLGTSRTNPARNPEDLARVLDT